MGRPGHLRIVQPASKTRIREELLWRQALGAQLRLRRQGIGKTLIEVAERAGVSPQYLSEVERGHKDPSSEMIAAIGGALELSLGGLLNLVSQRLEATASTAKPAAPQAQVNCHAGIFALAA